MIKSRLYLLALFLLCGSAFASNDVYLAQGATGGNTAVDCANAKAYTYFNSSGNWSATPTGIQIGPDTTVHLCVPITGTATAATNVLTTQGAGTSGHPVIIKFESGSSIKLPSCGTFSTNPTGGCINVQNQWITVDGNNVGVIQNTLNGTSSFTCPGGTCSLNNATAGVYVGASNVVVKNLTIADMYDRNPCNNSTNEASSYGVLVDGSGGSAFTNVTVQGVTIHDALNSIAFAGGGTNISNMTATGNTLSRASAEVVLAEGGGAATATNTTVSFNNIFDNYVWWDVADSDHLNGMHLFAAATGTHMVGVVVNGNYIHGDFGGNTCGGGGSHTTASIYIETTGGGTASGVQTFNNKVVTGLNDDPSGGMIAIGDSSDAGAQIYNNTLIADPTSGPTQGKGMVLTGTTLKIQDNLIAHTIWGIYLNGAGVSQITTSNTNDFYDTPGFRYGVTEPNFAGWQAQGFDANSFGGMALTSVTAGANAIYTGTIVGGGSNALAGKLFTFNGFTNGAGCTSCASNNVTDATIISSTTTTLTIALSTQVSCTNGNSNCSTGFASQDPLLSVSPSFVPQAGSIVIGAGLNLTSLGITALDTDFVGAARPPVAAWDMGALQGSSGGGAAPAQVIMNGGLVVSGGISAH